MNSQSLSYIERIYSDYLSNAENVSPEWRQFFQENGWRAGVATPEFEAPTNGVSELAANAPPTNGPPPPPQLPPSASLPPTKPRSDRVPRVGGEGRPMRGDVQLVALQERVDQLIRNHRVRGHIIARLDPLKQPRPQPPELDPAYYGFTEADYDRVFSTRTSYGPQERTLREIVGWLRNTYCRYIGAQFMHIDDLAVRQLAAGPHGVD